MTEQKMPDAKAVNPRYGTARMSDVARALLRPAKRKAPPPEPKAEARRPA